MAGENVSQGGGVKRTKILRSGVRARAEKPGETEAQWRRWQIKWLAKGIASMVFPSQALLDTFCANLKARQKREDLRDRLQRMYLSGELVAKPKQKASKTVATA